MPSLSYYNVQKAIYEKLTGNSQLMALINGVFDNVPQETAFPFVTIGDVFASESSSLGKNGVEQKLSINIWSREAGHKQASVIMDVIYGLLHNGVLTIAGQIIITVRTISSSIRLEDDGWTYHGIINIMVVMTDS
jgi:hypothetical protein